MGWGLIFLVAAGSAFLLILRFHAALERRLLESVLNQNTKKFFAGSIRVGEARLDRRLKIHIEHLRGRLLSGTGPVALEIQSIESQGPVTDFFLKQGLVLVFKGFRPGQSQHGGIQGTSHLRGGREGFIDLRAEVDGLDLHEIEWLNPENLSGATGELRGEMTFRSDTKGEVSYSARLQVEEPGGHVQTRFFDLLKPYLPQQLETREKIDHLLATGGVVGFREASLQADWAESDRMKVFLHITVPDYNLVLNLNLEIRVDEKNAFMQLTQLMGLLKIQSAG